MQFYQSEIATVIKNLASNLEKGLSSKQAQDRLQKHGINKLPEKPPSSIFVILIRQFINPLIFILLIASLISLLIKEYNDALIILSAVVINAILGFIQELKAERAAEALKSHEVAHCLVKRDGKKISINAQNLVPGDIVILTAGSRVPADMRLTSCIDLSIEEALLTGESNPVIKQSDPLTQESIIGDQVNMAFAGTYVINGKGKGIVTKTGHNTELGKIADSIIDMDEEVTPLQDKIKKLSWVFGGVMLGVVSLIFCIGLLYNMSFHEILLISIALAVAAIPEGLVITVTAILAVGMQRMLKRKALIRHLVASETLGNVSVICTDKTGTLTEGRMKVKKLITQQHNIDLQATTSENELAQKEVQEVLIAGILNNDVEELKNGTLSGSPSEVALFSLAQQGKIDIAQYRLSHPRIHEKAFSSTHKYMATAHSFNGNEELIIKGAPEVIFSMSLPESVIHFKKQTEILAQEGLRLIAIAVKKEKQSNLDSITDATCIGLIGIQDPLRAEAVQTIQKLSNAGIRVVLATGDHKDTAANIARGIGLSTQDNEILTGKELEALSPEELLNRIEKINVFARIEPQHKIQIVESWQQKGEAVAMIGDGINDAPALKGADIGVSVGSGSAVTHEASDIILLNDNLATIGHAVYEGRVIFDNIRKSIVYQLTNSLSEITLICSTLLLGLPLPILATQIFWVNLIADGFPNISFTTEPGEADIMKNPPNKPTSPLLNAEMRTIIFLIGTLTNFGLLILYLYLYYWTSLDLTHIRTIVFTALTLDSLLYIFSVRSMRSSLWHMNFFENKMMIASVLTGFSLQVLVVYTPFLQQAFKTVPLSFSNWALAFGFSSLKLICIEITKYFFITRNKMLSTDHK